MRVSFSSGAAMRFLPNNFKEVTPKMVPDCGRDKSRPYNVIIRNPKSARLHGVQGLTLLRNHVKGKRFGYDEDNYQKVPPETFGRKNNGTVREPPQILYFVWICRKYELYFTIKMYTF